MSEQDRKQAAPQNAAEASRDEDQFHAGRLVLFGVVALIVIVGAIFLSRMI
ncbi:MAG: hypothetical protein IKC51_10530 [Myxococcaceae bacterium]|nr:hypothetical protein [Myxococcaceae bacterium]